MFEKWHQNIADQYLGASESPLRQYNKHSYWHIENAKPSLPSWDKAKSNRLRDTLAKWPRLGEESKSCPLTRQLPKRVDAWYRKWANDFEPAYAAKSDRYIYAFAFATEFHHLKIGQSGNVSRRLNQVRAYLPFEVHPVFSCRVTDANEAEKELHEILAAWHVSREWFVLEFQTIQECFAPLRKRQVRNGGA